MIYGILIHWPSSIKAWLLWALGGIVLIFIIGDFNYSWSVYFVAPIICWMSLGGKMSDQIINEDFDGLIANILGVSGFSIFISIILYFS
tara:strand:+ start:504 stop:770 length:267 start_codon:yes stop_codon:yes gene_type:complete